MLFRQLFDRESSTYTYLIAKDYGQKAIIIDPVKNNVEQYIQLIKELGLTLTAALDTHLHADHITGLGPLNQALGCQSMMGEQSSAQCVSKRLTDQEQLSIDGLTLKILYTPGHTDDSYCFLLGDRVFTGDTLLIRGTGRTDFQNGDAGRQYDSLFNSLLTLPKETLVYPAHDYKGMTVSSIGEEIQYNPRLQVKSRTEYMQLMGELNLPNPKMMDIAVPANQKCGLD